MITERWENNINILKNCRFIRQLRIYRFTNLQGVENYMNSICTFFSNKRSPGGDDFFITETYLITFVSNIFNFTSFWLYWPPRGWGMISRWYFSSLKYMHQHLLITFVDWAMLIFCDEHWTSCASWTVKRACQNSDVDICEVSGFQSICRNKLDLQGLPISIAP